MSPNPAGSGEPITFDASSSDPGTDGFSGEPGVMQSYDWDLNGNGSFESHGPVVTHSYSDLGTQEVTLRVRSDTGSATASTSMVTTSSGSAAAPRPVGCPGLALGEDCPAPPETADPLAAQTDEPTQPRRQPDSGQNPVFHSYLSSVAGSVGFGSERTAVAQGHGKLFVLNDSLAKAHIFDADSDQQTGEFFVGPDARDIALYRGEVYVADENNELRVYDEAGQLRRSFTLGHQTVTVPPLMYTAVDVAWREAWITFRLASQQGGGVLVLDTSTGAIKGMSWHTEHSSCALHLDSGYTAKSYCVRSDGTQFSPDTAGTIRANEKFAPGISAAPELGALVTDCRALNRLPVLGLSTSFDSFFPLGEVPLGSLVLETCIGNSASESLQGSTEVWGMAHLLQMRRTPIGDYVDEYILRRDDEDPSGPAQLAVSPDRSWRPQEHQAITYRDVAYRARETRVDWSGALTKNPSDWLRSPSNTEDKCLHYVISEADIYIVGPHGEHWYELAQGVNEVKLLIDGAQVKTSAQPIGNFCINTRLFSNGVHTAELIVYVDNRTRTITAKNPSLRIDNAPPAGALDAVPKFMQGQVSFAGSMADPHSGNGTWQMSVQRAGDPAWRPICTESEPPARPACGWDTTQTPDGRYTVRASMIDKATDGGNQAFTAQPQTTVDNFPPSFTASGELKDREDLAPLYDDERPAVTVAASDAGSGVKSVEVRVDGISRSFQQQPCDAGACGLTHTFTMNPADYTEGEHEILVSVLDQLGHEATQKWTVSIEEVLAPPDTDTSSSQMSTPVPGAPEVDEPTGPIIPDNALEPGTPKFDATKFLNCSSDGEPANFDVFVLGASFEGLALTESYRRCDAPNPPIPWRANLTSYIYGTCDPNENGFVIGSPGAEWMPDAHCTPPLEVQTWPLCERNPANYEIGYEGEELLAAQAEEHLQILGVPAAWYDDHTVLELYAGSSTVAIFGDDPAQMLRAANVLRRIPAGSAPIAPPSSNAPPPTSPAPLKPPSTAALGGAVPCSPTLPNPTLPNIGGA